MPCLRRYSAGGPRAAIRTSKTAHKLTAKQIRDTTIYESSVSFSDASGASPCRDVMQ